MVWLGAPSGDDEDLTLGDTLSDPAVPTDIDLGLASDVRRFVAALTPRLRGCCAILTEPNVAEAARIAGQHRSAVYDGVARLRLLASAVGLHDYLVSPRHIGSPAGK